MLPLAGYDGSLQYRAGLHRRAWMEKSQRKPVRCRGYITGGIHYHSERATNGVCTISFGYAVEPADQRNRRIPLVRFEAVCIKIFIRTISQKETPAHAGVLLINACK